MSYLVYELFKVTNDQSTDGDHKLMVLLVVEILSSVLEHNELEKYENKASSELRILSIQMLDV
jgi:hypothetical protein